MKGDKCIQVVLTRGYGQEKENKAHQEKFLNQFKKILNSYGLEITSMTSERDTGGPITFETPQKDPDIVIRVFLGFATDLVREDEEHEYVSFDLKFPFCPEPICITGSAY